MAFFRQFPKVGYDFQQNGVITNIIDIFRSVKVDTVFLDDMSTYQYYQVRNGERPDIVSTILYGDRKSTCLNSSHVSESRMPSSA